VAVVSHFSFLQLPLLPELAVEGCFDVDVSLSRRLLFLLLILCLFEVFFLRVLEHSFFDLFLRCVAFFEDCVGHATHCLLDTGFPGSPFIRSLLVFLVEHEVVFVQQLDRVCFFGFLLLHSLSFFDFVFADNNHGLLPLKHFFLNLGLLFLVEGLLQLSNFFLLNAPLLAEDLLLPLLRLLEESVSLGLGRKGFKLQFVFLLLLSGQLFLGFRENHFVHLLVFLQQFLLEPLLFNQLPLQSPLYVFSFFLKSFFFLENSLLVFHGLIPRKFAPQVA